MAVLIDENTKEIICTPILDVKTTDNLKDGAEKNVKVVKG